MSSKCDWQFTQRKFLPGACTVVVQTFFGKKLYYSRYQNTDAIFEKPTKFDYRVKEKDFNKDAIRIALDWSDRLFIFETNYIK